MWLTLNLLQTIFIKELLKYSVLFIEKDKQFNEEVQISFEKFLYIDIVVHWSF